MGTTSSKLRRYLEGGDEYAVLHMYNTNKELQKTMDVNASYGEAHGHNTAVHLAAIHGMEKAMRVFLYVLDGDPNKANGNGETALHCLCMGSPRRRMDLPAQRRRLACLKLMLQWHGVKVSNSKHEGINLAALDKKENTALHFAASSGLETCVQMLVEHGAPMFKENLEKQTPCDLAEKAGHVAIATYLESRMVFGAGETVANNSAPLIDISELYHGLRPQDLQESKDQLLVETSDMLHVPLFVAEALLRNHEWSRELLFEAWHENAAACCEKCGVVAPDSALLSKPFDLFDSPDDLEQLSSPATLCSDPASPVTAANECGICASSDIPGEESVAMLCAHRFCQRCWQGHLNAKIHEGDAHNIKCPAYGCSMVVPVTFIEKVVSTDVARKYLQYDIQAFVESNPNIKWCPSPGCGTAVTKPTPKHDALSPTRALQEDWKLDGTSSLSVECCNGHGFCWDCLGEPHEPCSCHHWKIWLEKTAGFAVGQMAEITQKAELAANVLWMVSNSKPCPNCKTPIEKNEGCNHMRCTKCKHDFCWVCLESWKKHNSTTGGFFRCTRYEVVQKVDGERQAELTGALSSYEQHEEMNRFVHYYSRYRNHEHSLSIEKSLLESAKAKMLKLAQALKRSSSSASSGAVTAEAETSFITDAVQQLLKARRVLKHSYIFGYYLNDAGIKKHVFEFIQTELEEITEAMSEMISRPYLRTPRSKIIETACMLAAKRLEFVEAIAKGLQPLPSDSSPSSSKRYSFEIDADFKRELLQSLGKIDPRMKWVQDPKTGRHVNVAALLDWPSDNSDSSDDEKDAKSPDICHRHGCKRPKAHGPRTGKMHDYCSLSCLRDDHLTKTRNRGVAEQSIDDVIAEQMDLLHALEVSRLDYIRQAACLELSGGSNINSSDHGTTSVGLSASAPTFSGDAAAAIETHACARNYGGASVTEPSLLQEQARQLLGSVYQGEDADLMLAIELSLQCFIKQGRDSSDIASSSALQATGTD